MIGQRHPLASSLPEMCTWCSSKATCRVVIETPDMERRVGRIRKANACDRHAMLVAERGPSS